MKFFALDCHIGIRDIQFQFEKLGHTLDVASISGSAHLLNWEINNSYLVNQSNWRSLNSSNIDWFYRTHKDQLSRYDGFVCFYPPIFSMLYEHFEKPIIAHIPIRFEVPYADNSEELDIYIQHLRRTIDSGQLIPLTNNRFDQMYCTDVVGRQFNLIPSMCDYITVERTMTNNNLPIHGDIFNVVPNLDNTKRMSAGYDRNELYSHNAIIHFPYTNSLMSIFEQYNGNMPLLFPSNSFFLDLWRQNPQQTLSQISWRKVDKLPPKQLHKVNFVPDINSYADEKSVSFIIENGDWNDKEWFPHVLNYESWDHLGHLIKSTDFDEISNQIRLSGYDRRDNILMLWSDVLEKL